MRIIFLLPFPTGEVASQRFRVEQFLEHLRNAGHSLSIHTLFTLKEWRHLKENKNVLRRTLILGRAFLRRLGKCFSSDSSDMFFIHREAFPIGPPLIEWIISRLFGRKMIFDFDDAIWLTDNISESWLERFVRCRWKVKDICKWSFKVSCGNAYLANYASRFNASVIVSPTVVDTELYQSQTKENTDVVTVGWTGSKTTLKYLESIEGALNQIEEKLPKVVFLAIADTRPSYSGDRLQFRKWRLETEISDLHDIDIGLMPLPDDAWTRGKCGFKAIQYMAAGIPAIVSPVGVNNEIVTQGVDGFIASSDYEWVSAIVRLAQDRELRVKMGSAARKKIENHYSVASNLPTFLSLFK